MKRALPFIPIILLAISCSKDIKYKTQEYYFRFKANGVKKEYLVTNTSFYSENECTLSAGKDETFTYAIAIDISSGSKIKALETYSEAQTIPVSTLYYPQVFLRLADNYPTYNYSSWTTDLGGSKLYACNATILELDSKHVKGTVSGKVSNNAGTTFIDITEGEFNVKR